MCLLLHAGFYLAALPSDAQRRVLGSYASSFGRSVLTFENRHHVSVRNNVQGSRLHVFDESGGTGSNARLLASLFSSSAFFDGADSAYSHEFGPSMIQSMHLIPFTSGIP